MNRLYLALFLVLGAGVAATLLVFQYRMSKSSSYTMYREAYFRKAADLTDDPSLRENFEEQALLAPEGASRSEKLGYTMKRYFNRMFPNIEQRVIENSEWGTRSVSRCTTCHAAVENPDFQGNVSFDYPQYSEREKRQMERALTYHPDVSPHEFNEFSCVSCHGGNPRGLTLADAHGFHEEYSYLGNQPMTDERFAIWQQPTYTGDELHVKDYNQSLCVSCHSYPYPEPANDGVLTMEQVDRGRELFFARGCYSCHEISGLSWGQTGPAINDIGEEFRYEYLELSIWHPRANQEDSQMPYLFSDYETENEILYEKFEGDYEYNEHYGEDPRRSDEAAREVYALVTFLLSQRPEEWVTRPGPNTTREELMGPPLDRAPVPGEQDGEASGAGAETDGEPSGAEEGEEE